MGRKLVQVGLALCLVAVLAFVTLTLLEGQTQAQGSTLYVAPGGDCGEMMPCYAHLCEQTHMLRVDSAIHI